MLSPRLYSKRVWGKNTTLISGTVHKQLLARILPGKVSYSEIQARSGNTGEKLEGSWGW